MSGREPITIIRDILQAIVSSVERPFFSRSTTKDKKEYERLNGAVIVQDVRRKAGLVCSRQVNRYLRLMDILGLVVVTYKEKRPRKLVKITEKGKKLLHVYRILDAFLQPLVTSPLLSGTLYPHN